MNQITATRAPYPDFPSAYIDKSAQADADTMNAIYELWPRLCDAIDVLDELDDDGVPIEAFCHAYQMILQLSAYGVNFDDDFLAEMDELRSQIIGTDEESDYENSSGTDEGTQGSCPHPWMAADWKHVATTPLDLSALERIELELIERIDRAP
jgi:hypothetical protein